MKKIVKIAAYVVFTAGAILFGYAFLTHLPHAREIEVPEDAPPIAATNAPAASTNTTVVNTNTTATTTNAAVVSTNPAAAAAKPPVAAPPKQSSSHWGTYLGLFLFSMIGLACLMAYDIAHFVAHRADQFVFDDSVVVEKDPEYEEAEKVWANGRPLEAIQMLRDFLKKNPHAQYTALRIAEIYEKDLGNYVAAALEYEEILKKKLPAERWGWAAIHLSNLYSGKLNKTEQAEALLRRINEEHPRTGAAKKARERLGIPEPLPEVQPAANAPEAQSGATTEAEAAPKETTPPASNLPPGFRPKTDYH